MHVDATATSDPFDKIPLYRVQAGRVVTILLKSSQAVSSSALVILGTAENFHIRLHIFNVC